MPKLTDWFPPEVKPVRVGVYETEGAAQDGRCFAYWNGKAFGMRKWWRQGPTFSFVIEMADDDRESFNYDLSWRGLAEKPE